MDIRPVRPDEYAPLGELTYAAYAAIIPGVLDNGYGDELRDVGGRVALGATVLAAVDDDGTLLGGVTYVGDPSSPLAEHSIEDAASIRMLAVAIDHQGRGVGEALSRACLDLARRDGRSEIVLHSTRWMTTAHRLYERLGFRRDESLDWAPVPEVELLAFRLVLDGA